MAALELHILAPRRFLVIAEGRAVRYDCSDPQMAHGGSDVITPLSGGVRRFVEHYCLAQFVTGCPFDLGAAHLAYRSSAEIYWSFLRQSNCWFPSTFNDGRVHQLPVAEVTSYKRTASGKLATSQMLAARVIIWVVDK